MSLWQEQVAFAPRAAKTKWVLIGKSRDDNIVRRNGQPLKHPISPPKKRNHPEGLEPPLPVAELALSHFLPVHAKVGSPVDSQFTVGVDLQRGSTDLDGSELRFFG